MYTLFASTLPPCWHIPTPAASDARPVENVFVTTWKIAKYLTQTYAVCLGKTRTIHATLLLILFTRSGGGGFVLLQKIKPCPHNREKEFTIQDLGHTRGAHSHTMQIIRSSMHKQIRWLKEL